MTREEKSNLLNELLDYEENNDIGNLTRAERREFQQWISKALEQEPFINKPCVSSGVCEHDKQKVLEKIRAEIEQIIGERNLDDYDFCSGLICARKIIDKYKAESESA